MAYTKYSLTPANNNAAPPDGAPEGMLPSAVNDTMRDMMSQIRDVGDGIRGGTYTMTAPVITGGSITGVALSGNTLTNPVITGGSINNTPIGATTASTGRFSDLTDTGLTSGRVIYAGTGGNLVDDADFTFNGTTVTIANDASISGLTVGKGGGASGTSVAVGNGAIAATNTGGFITAVGNSALNANTGGTQNSGFGANALIANTTGSSNSSFGVNSLYSNTTADANAAFGSSSLFSNTTGANNTAIGIGSLNANTTASNNTAVGYRAAYSNTTGTFNVAIGGSDTVNGSTLYSNTTGNNNTAIGTAALLSNTTASNNTAVGYQAGYSGNGNDNTIMGWQAGYSLSSGSYNAIFGRYAGNALTTGTYNSFIGINSGYLMTTGSKNTILGAYSGNQGGLDIRTASNYIVLSDGDGNPHAYFASASYSDMYLNSPTGAPYVVLNFRLGGTTVSYQYYDASQSRFYVVNSTNGVYLAANATAWTSASDEKLKNITGEIQNGLQKVCSLRAAEYTWKSDETAKPQVGLIAQDVIKVLPEIVNVPEEGALNKDGSPAAMGVEYTGVIPLLVAAIKELNAKLEAQALEIATLKGN